MMFTNLMVNNFGPYKDRHEFDLRPETDDVNSRPIILFGGLNGSGKTKLLEAIQLALYGPSILGPRTAVAKYHRLLRRWTYRSELTGEASGSATIALDFDHNFIGRTEHYTVIRSWKLLKTKVSEKLVVHKDGEPLSDILMEQWQDFLKELVPPGLSNLFFFDGEKIEILAKRGKVDNYIKEALGTLLGLDNIEQLQSDLNLLAARQTKEMGGDKNLPDDLQFVQENAIKLKDEIDELRIEIDGCQEQSDKRKRDIENLEIQLSNMGGAFAEKRTSNKEKLLTIETELEGIKEQIGQLLTETIPFALCPSISNSLIARLGREQEYEKQKAVSKVVDEFAAKIKKEYKTRSKKLDKAVSKASEDYRLKSSNIEVIHDISKSERDMMKNWIDDANNRASDNLRALCNQFESLNRQSEGLSLSLQRAPPEKALGSIVKELTIKSEEIGKLEELIESLNYDYQDTENKIGENNRKIEIIEDKLDSKAGVIDQIGLNRKVKNVLVEFFKDRSARKLEELEVNIMDALISLSRKEKLNNRIEIDPETLEVTIYDTFDTPIDRKDMSAGERQIFAISLLWALAKTAERPLPFIIDTPLSRLDSAHRENMVANFFSSASHQIFVLSTDTEIDKEYYATLEPYISRAYHLDYNQETTSTNVSSGYFWDSRSLKA